MKKGSVPPITELFLVSRASQSAKWKPTFQRRPQLLSSSVFLIHSTHIFMFG